MFRSVLVTPDNPALADLQLSWKTAIFTAHDGMGPLRSLHEAGDALVAVAMLDENGVTVLGSGVMVGPGLLVTASHVLDEFPRDGSPPVLITFLPKGTRAWLPFDVATLTRASQFDQRRTIVSDLSLISCSLNSEAHADVPLMVAPMEIALPLIGQRLWAIGFRHQAIEDGAACITPMISSGLTTAAYPNGRGERMPSPCFEVNMDVVGGMSGGAVVNADGYLVGIVSSGFEGGPTYVTLIWDALRLRVKSSIPKLQANETVSLLGARALGLVKLKGNVDRNPWGDLTLRLSPDEGRLLAVSSMGRPSGFSEDERAHFIETWGDTLETIGTEATIEALTSLPLPKMRKYLSAEDIPEHCLEAIVAFSVADYDGVEDMELISTEIIGHGDIGIEYFFELRMLVWSVDVSADAYRRHGVDFRKHFINVRERNSGASMDLVQRRYFKAETIFNQDRSEFCGTQISSSAIRRRG